MALSMGNIRATVNALEPFLLRNKKKEKEIYKIKYSLHSECIGERHISLSQ